MLVYHLFNFYESNLIYRPKDLNFILDDFIIRHNYVLWYLKSAPYLDYLEKKCNAHIEGLI